MLKKPFESFKAANDDSPTVEELHTQLCYPSDIRNRWQQLMQLMHSHGVRSPTILRNGSSRVEYGRGTNHSDAGNGVLCKKLSPKTPRR